MGTGYVGLVAGAGFAEFGNDVICVDINAERIASLQRGQVPIYEPGLEEVIKRNSENGRLQFSTDTGASVGNAEVIFIAIGTPSGEDGSADLAHILAATKSIAKGLLGPSIVVTKSTVPIGTGDRIEAVLREHTKHEVSVVSNPESIAG
jgi:UDPglucose 6-dehydrogenase